MAKIDQISDTDDWNETSGNGFLTSLVPFIEAKIVETNNHTIKDILEESLEHELLALSLYKKLLKIVADASIYLEEYTRTLIGEEEQHQLELRKMLKDFS